MLPSITHFPGGGVQIGGSGAVIYPPITALPDYDPTAWEVGLTKGEFKAISKVVNLPVIYGTRKINGITVYLEQRKSGTGASGYHHVGGPFMQAIVLGEGEVNDITGVWVDDVYYALTEDQVRSRTYILNQHAVWDLYILNYNGSDSQLADNGEYEYDSHAFTSGNLNSDSPNTSWSPDHKLSGVAHVDFLFRTTDYRTTPSQGQLPKLQFLVSGLISGSTNPALILKDYLTNTRYGCSIPGSEIDTTSFTTAEGVCNQTNNDTHSDGTTISTKRHECNILLDTAKPLLDNIKLILSSCNGQLHWINGKYKMHIDDVFTGSNVFDFEEKHIIGGLKIIGESKNNRANQVKAKFVNPDTWKSDEVSWPDTSDANYTTFLTEDNDVPLKKEVTLQTVTNWYQARFIAQQACLLSRNSLGFQFTATSEALNIVVGDIISVTHSTPAWSAKKFIVRSVGINIDGTINLSGVEYQAATYTWDNATAPAVVADTDLPNVTSVDAPTNLVFTESTYSSVASAGLRVQAQLSWTDNSTYTFVSGYDFQYKKIQTGFVTKQWVLDVGDGGKVIFSSKNHGFPENMPIVFTAEGTVPNGVLIGIVAGTTYYVRPGVVWAGSSETYILNGLANNFHVSATPDGPNIDLAFSVLTPDVDGAGHSVVNPESDWIEAGSTVSSSAVINDFETGTFDFRVRAKTQSGAFSDFVTITDQLVEGITNPPEDVVGFNVSNHGSNAIVSWDAPADSTDIDHIQIGVLQEGSVLWDDAVPVAQVGVGNTTTTLPVIDGNYVAKWVNSSGLESTDYLDSGSVSVFGSELVATFAEQELWAGTLDGFYETVDDGDDVLRFLGSSLWDSVTENIDNWSIIDGLGGRTEPATYTGVKRDLGAALPMRIYTTKIFTSLVTDGSNYMDLWGKVDLRSSFDPISQLDNLTTEVRVTQDDPAAVDATWTAYKPFLVIDVVARGVQIKVTFDQFDTESQFTLRELSLLVDMVTRQESDRAKTATSITYSDPFYTIPDLVVTPINMATGDYMTISSEAKTGFGINFYNSSAVAQTRTYNYIARGV